MSRVFNGTSDKITLATSASLDTIGTKLTLMAWVYLTDISLPRPIFQLRVGQGSAIAEFLFVQATGTGNDRSLVGAVPAASSFAESISSEFAIPLNTWTHCAMTYDDTGDRQVHLYVNGVETGYLLFNSAVGAQTSNSGFPAYVGSDEYGDFWAGDLAEDRAYNIALTAGQIAAVAADTTGNPNVGGLGVNLISYNHLCGDNSPEPDSSGNGNVGILTGTTKGPNSPGFSCPLPGPVVLSIVPVTGVHCTTFDVEVDGTGFDAAGTSTLSFSGSGVIVNFYHPGGGATKVLANITVRCDAALVGRDVTVKNSNGAMATLPAAFLPLQLTVQWWSLKNLQLYMSPDPTMTIRGGN